MQDQTHLFALFTCKKGICVRSVAFNSFGGPEVLYVSERPACSPGPDEVLVEVEARSNNPTDILMRSDAQRG